MFSYKFNFSREARKDPRPRCDLIARVHAVRTEKKLLLFKLKEQRGEGFKRNINDNRAPKKEHYLQIPNHIKIKTTNMLRYFIKQKYPFKPRTYEELKNQREGAEVSYVYVYEIKSL